MRWGGGHHLLLSYTKPHERVTKATIARWIKTGVTIAGVDTLVFKAHSTRSALLSLPPGGFKLQLTISPNRLVHYLNK